MGITCSECDQVASCYTCKLPTYYAHIEGKGLKTVSQIFSCCGEIRNVTLIKKPMVTGVTQGAEVISSIMVLPSSITTAPTLEARGNTSGRGLSNTAKEVNNCAALSGGLGALAILMGLGLVGVIIGWVWSCHRRRER